MKIKKLTSVSRKFVGVPRTNEEKFERLVLKNPALKKLRETFGLDVEL
tara:strand:- start:20009 stop:20152 length:144 start_codon:yes stop_codon:yes gene_type:complete